MSDTSTAFPLLEADASSAPVQQPAPQAATPAQVAAPAIAPKTIGQFTIRKAERKQAFFRASITGLSGSGKTTDALFLAYGITADWSKIVLIDSENGSGELYSNMAFEIRDEKGMTQHFVVGEYGYLRLDPPFSPERFIEAIAAAEQFGAEVIIIDSSTHEWEGPGGVLECVDKLKATTKDQKNGPWGIMTPRHAAFINKIIRAKAHVITTTRRKAEYGEEVVNGKKKYVKLGTKEIQREGFEYEHDIVLEVDLDHTASVQKDRTRTLPEGRFMVTPYHGEKIRRWFESAVPIVPSTSGTSAFASHFDDRSAGQGETRPDGQNAPTSARKRLGELLGQEFGDDVTAKQQKLAELTGKVIEKPYRSLAEMSKEDAQRVLDAIDRKEITL